MTDSTNILNVLAMATDTEIAAGKAWYAEARELAATMARTAPRGWRLNTGHMAGIIAALSPRTAWDRNKELAIRAVADGEASGTLTNSVKAANRMLAGEDPLDVLKSDKVRNFYLSIMGDTAAVCVDRHALEVYLGVRYADKERPAIGKKLYREASAAYVAASYGNYARELGLTPTQVQAITWLVWRRIHLTGTRYERFL